MKKIVVLNGSPHAHGCTAALAEKVVKAAEQRAAEVKTYHLNTMNIKGCQGCFRCQQTGRCATEDDMQPIYDDIAAADGIVLASPVYMWSMSAQLKAAVDRLFAFLRPEHQSALTPGKKVLLLFTQGQNDTNMFRHYFEHVGKNMQFMGFGDYDILVAGGTHVAEHVYSQKDVLEDAERLGKWLSE
ncbi:Multimeric flavodoxin WrbA [Sporobacter termitidis DSM 10068]|uniref:Multimeric flavodoxin WrbA n=1 Tax=Sporobacter termitidis DSM 10068 TaxID=1123282 RepID=A0A1M5Z9D5_9FIRM|nr:flavodoxin family protein [Sporobacter termitidis]SHI20837.1 Multimeric flavodoxin WrbA [Sporobacter termitidis DSM 10068]